MNAPPPLAPVLLGSVLVVLLVAAGASQPRGGEGRTRPPEAFTCRPDDLTSYTGRVTDYRRESGRTRIRIRTDWDTDEKVTIRHPGNDDPSPWFRFRGQMFADSDWSQVEVRHGKLHPGIRATAWVCRDGRTIVDWEVPRE